MITIHLGKHHSQIIFQTGDGSDPSKVTEYGRLSIIMDDDMQSNEVKARQREESTTLLHTLRNLIIAGHPVTLITRLWRRIRHA